MSFEECKPADLIPADGIVRSSYSRTRRPCKHPRADDSATDGSSPSQVSVIPLLLNGKPVAGAPRWIRVIQPYFYTFTSHSKERWLNRTILDVYTTEFGFYDEGYYESAIREGRIRVNDEVVEPEYCIGRHDTLTHRVLRSEPAVAVATDKSPHVHIVAETDDLLVVDKPGTMPIHPCGGYHLNSLMNLLEAEGFAKLHTIHRLDRLTSGCVVLGKNAKIAAKWSRAIHSRECEKIYLARVKGRFPTQCPTSIPRLDSAANRPVAGVTHDADESGFKSPYERARAKNAYCWWVTNAKGDLCDNVSLEDVARSPNFSVAYWLKLYGNDTNDSVDVNSMLWFHLSCPTRVEQPKIGICGAGTFSTLEEDLYLKTVKPAQTAFATVRYDRTNDTSLILCRPETGRTHQIRIHLKHVAHNIANDPNYGGDLWHSAPAALKACEEAQSLLDMAHDAVKVAAPGVLASNVKASPSGSQGDDATALEFLIRSPGIWLHALRYSLSKDSGDKGERVSFTMDLPTWSEEQV